MRMDKYEQVQSVRYTPGGLPIRAALAHGPKSQILFMKHIKYERISLRRWNYSNYAPNTPQ